MCEELGLKKYFKSIHGSPESKIKIVYNIIKENNYLKNKTFMIGDSINDKEAADENNIIFCGYNNIELDSISDFYIESFAKIDFYSDVFLV